MSDILQLLGGVIGSGQVQEISRKLGADEETTSNAIGAALPTLLGVLTRNASQGEGAEALHSALSKDHDGSVLDNVGDYFSKEQYAQPRGGDDILKHMLGGRRGQVEQGLSQVSGLNAGSTGQLLTMLAPLVLGALGKKQREGNLDTASLVGLLGKEEDEVKREAPEQASILGKLLDQDGDGDFDISDAARMGMGMLGKMMSRGK